MEKKTSRKKDSPGKNPRPQKNYHLKKITPEQRRLEDGTRHHSGGTQAMYTDSNWLATPANTVILTALAATRAFTLQPR